MIDLNKGNDYILTNIKNYHENKEAHLTISEQNRKINRASKSAFNELKEKIATLKEVNNELEHFAHVCSHDLREPLRTIHHFIQLLSKQKFDCTTKEYFSHILSSTKRMDNLVHDILSSTVSDDKNYKPENVDLGEVIEEIKEDLIFLISETNTQIITSRLPVVLGNHVQLTRLFKNLLENSIKFRSTLPPKIQIKVDEDRAECWHVQVIDNGIGIAKKYHNTIFDMFKRLDDRRYGFGIGLSVCKKIVERHGGNIWIGNNTDGGSTFNFTLAKEQ